MMRFEELPRNIRVLMLSKLVMEMNTLKSHNIHHLAKMRQTDVAGLWRSICRKAGQPMCTIPVEALSAVING
jgi:hypothetical protein